MKKLIALVLCFSLILAGSTMCFAAETQGEQKKIDYVSLGESNSVGVGLLDYYRYRNDTEAWEFGRDISGSYPSLIAESLAKKCNAQIDFHQLSIPGLRVYDLRALLDTDYPLDNLFCLYENLYVQKALQILPEYRGKDTSNIEGEDLRQALSPYFVEYVKNADLITLDCAENNISSIAARMRAGYDSVDMSQLAHMIGSNKYLEIKKSVLAKIGSLSEKLHLNTDEKSIQSLIEGLIYGYVDATYNFDKLVERIYELNPDVELVVVDVVSSMDEDLLCAIEGLGEVKAMKILSMLLDMVREYRRSVSPYSKTYKFATLNDPETYVDELFASDYQFSRLSPDTVNGMKMTLKNILDQSNWSILDDEEQFEKTIDRFQAVVKMKRRNMTSNYNEMPANLEKYLLGEVDFSELSDEEKIAFAQKTFLEFTTGGFPGSHPNAKGHQQRADAVMTAIGSSLNARQVKAIEIGTKLQTIKFEMHNLIGEGLHNSLKIVIPPINCVIKKIVHNIGFPK